MPDLAPELAAIADGIEANDVRSIEQARRVADRAVRQLCDETGVPAIESVTHLIDALLAKHAMPHTIAAHLRVLYDAESSMVGDAGRALVAFLEWRIGSRSRMSARLPATYTLRELGSGAMAAASTWASAAMNFSLAFMRVPSAGCRSYWKGRGNATRRILWAL